MKLLGVIGASTCSSEMAALARQVGREIAARGFGLICGGLGGVMEASCRGAHETGGLTVGILPGCDPGAANPYVGIPIASGLGEARNLLIVRSAAALIAIGGEYGTLSELAFALKLGTPVVGLETWELRAPGAPAPAPVHSARDAAHAVARALELAGLAAPAVAAVEGGRVRGAD